MKKKKAVSVLLICNFLLSLVFSISVYAKGSDRIYSYENYYGETIYYYKDCNGDEYIIENGERVYISVPVSVERITDPNTLAELRQLSKSAIVIDSSNEKSSVFYSKIMNFSNQQNPSNIDSTSVLYITSDYFRIKCTNLNPSGATRGFSYYVRFSPNGSDWFQELNVNKSLLFYTKHNMGHYGDGPYIQIKMWSYYGTVSSCTLLMD